MSQWKIKLNGWAVWVLPSGQLIFSGEVSGHTRLADGTVVITSGIRHFDQAEMLILTRNSRYRLGTPSNESIESLLSRAQNTEGMAQAKLLDRHDAPEWLTEVARRCRISARRAQAREMGQHDLHLTQF